MSIITSGLCHKNILTGGLGEIVSVLFEEDVIEILQRPVVLKHKTAPSPTAPSTTNVVNVIYDVNETLTPDHYKIVSQLFEVNGKTVVNPLYKNSILVLPNDGTTTDIIVKRIDSKTILEKIESKNINIKKLDEEFKIKIKLII